MIPATSGALAKPLIMSIERELNQSDIMRLVSMPRERTAAPVLQKIKSVHHTMARLVAEGRTAIEIAALVNRTPQRIRDLQIDPAFSELVSYYSQQIQGAAIDDAKRLQSKLVVAAEAAWDEVMTRLDDDLQRKQIPTNELRQIAQMGLDRTVAPPKTAAPATSPPAQITFNIMGNKQLTQKTIDITPEPNSPPTVSLSKD